MVAKLDISLPFILSALLGLGFFLLYGRWGDRNLATVDATQKPVPFLAVARVLLQDRRLVCFTLGGLLSAVVFGQFTAYLSQYLVTTTTAEYTYTVISAVLTTNAVLVIALQYLIGRRISHRYLSQWLIAGLSMFMLGLIGFLAVHQRGGLGAGDGGIHRRGNHRVPGRVHVYRPNCPGPPARHVLRGAKPVQPRRRAGAGAVWGGVGQPASPLHVLHARGVYRCRRGVLFHGSGDKGRSSSVSLPTLLLCSS